MKHITLDCYGGSQHLLNDLTQIYQLLNGLSYKFNLEPIAPPHLIPYYYGRVKEDSGISAFILLKGGHITIHTFPFRECYFVDILTPCDFDEQGIYSFFMSTLPFNRESSYLEVIDRTQNSFDMLPYSKDIDFGPHMMTTVESKKEVTMDSVFNFLENLVTKIDMDPITRASVLKDKTNDPHYISGIIIIAQSHIALHYDIEKKIIYADLFSCAPFNYEIVDTLFEDLGSIVSHSLVPRGTKHIYKVKSKITDTELEASTLWQKNIGINK